MTPKPNEIVAPEFLSPSSISTWQQCPQKFKYSRIDKLVDPPTEATVLGNFVHAVLESLLLLPKEERTLVAARALMRQHWESEYMKKATDVLYSVGDKLHRFRWMAWWCVENYFKMENPAQLEFSGLEQYVTGSIAERPIRGYIDRWHQQDGSIVIGDYKTGKTPKPQWRGDKFQQLLIYAHLLQDEHRLPVSKLELLYLKDGVRLVHEVKADDLDKVRSSVKQVNDELTVACETGYFPTVKQRLCNWCSYKSFCPAWTNKS